MGPLGKLHSIVVYIGLTPQRRQKFKKLSGGLLVHRDQKTRWNSFYEMIDWAIENIKDAIIRFSTKEIDLEKDVLKSSEWHSKSNGVTGPMSNVKSSVERHLRFCFRSLFSSTLRQLRRDPLRRPLKASLRLRLLQLPLLLFLIRVEVNGCCSPLMEGSAGLHFESSLMPSTHDDVKLPSPDAML